MIKLIALAVMVIDHAPRIILGEPLYWTTAIGRIAFPAFAYLAARGAVYTRNPSRYIALLILFGLLAQPLHTVILMQGQLIGNVLFTLALGVIALRDWRWVPVCAVCSLGVEYGVAGVLLVYATGECIRVWHLFPDRPVPVFGACAAAATVLAFVQPMQWWPIALTVWTVCMIATLDPQLAEWDARWQLRRLRLGFYAFYPAHIAAIGIAASVVG